MKRLLWATAAAFIVAAASSFSPGDKDDKKKDDDKKKQTKKQDKLPPGTTQIKDSVYMDSLFIDEYEVSNADWEDCLNYLIEHPKDSIKNENMRPDSTVWDKMDPQLALYYFHNPQYWDYPVVGISYQQAVNFCKWRTDRVNEYYKDYPEANPYPDAKYVYRLPTMKEWEMVAAGGRNADSLPYGQDSIWTKYKKKWVKTFNSIYGNRDDLYSVERTTVAPVQSFFPNDYGVYNYIGNVAEMVAEKGIAKGGGFDSEIKYSTIQDIEKYTKPVPFLGFRCICQIQLSAAEIREKKLLARQKALEKEREERAGGKKKGHKMEIDSSSLGSDSLHLGDSSQPIAKPTKESKRGKKKGKMEIDTTGLGPIDSTTEVPNEQPKKEDKKSKKKGRKMEIDSSEVAPADTSLQAPAEPPAKEEKKSKKKGKEEKTDATESKPAEPTIQTPTEAPAKEEKKSKKKGRKMEIDSSELVVDTTVQAPAEKPVKEDKKSKKKDKKAEPEAPIVNTADTLSPPIEEPKKEEKKSKKKDRKKEVADTTTVMVVDTLPPPPVENPKKEEKKSKKKGKKMEVDSTDLQAEPAVDSTKKDGGFNWKKLRQQGNNEGIENTARWEAIKDEEMDKV